MFDGFFERLEKRIDQRHWQTVRFSIIAAAITAVVTLAAARFAAPAPQQIVIQQPAAK